MPQGIDSWKVIRDKVVRYHMIRKKKLFNPLPPEGCPIPIAHLGPRVADAKYKGVDQFEIICDESWKGKSGKTHSLGGFWTGTRTFTVLAELAATLVGVADEKPRAPKRAAQERVSVECCCSPTYRS